MLEKNKDYIEMRVSSTDCAFTQNAATTISIEGFSYGTFFRLPDPGESYVVISKEKFEKMQADVNINAEIAKQWEINYDLLLKKIGFDTVEELVNYLNSEAECDTLREAIASLEFSVKFARDERRDLSKKLEECEKDYISARDKAEALQTENEQLKKKLHEFDPVPDYKEVLGKLYSTEDIEKLEWTLNHICGGQASVNGWKAASSFWRQKFEAISKLVGFSSVEEIQDYLTNEAECDTLQEAISKLKDQVKYTCDEWYSANSRNNSWKAAAECNSPKELIEKREALQKEIEVYSRALQEWKEGTGCPSPSAVKTMIESQASWCHAYHEVKKANEKLADNIQKWKDMTKCETPEAAATWITSYESACGRGNRLAESVEKLKEEVVSWKNVTGYSTPEDYMHARINCATPFDLTVVWQDATGCVTPDQVKSRIEGLENAVRLTNRNMIKELESNIDEWQKFTGCDSPQESGCKINRLCDEICKLKGDYEHLLELTGYKNEKGICAALVFSDENHLYITMRDLINSLKRKAKFTESNWQKATGCDSPEAAETTLRNLRGRIDEIKEFAAIASNWTDRIVEG